MRKIIEGVDDWAGQWATLESSTGDPGSRHKLAETLKKDLKKLRRQREQVRGWLASGEVKDDGPLLVARQAVENHMHTYRQLERESEIKCFSSKGLAREGMSDPVELAKYRCSEWLNGCYTKLEEQAEVFEAELEALGPVGGRNGRATKSSFFAANSAALSGRLHRHREYQAKIERVLRLLENNHVAGDEVEGSLKDSLNYYIEENGEDVFIVDEGLWDAQLLGSIQKNVGKLLSHRHKEPTATLGKTQPMAADSMEHELLKDTITENVDGGGEVPRESDGEASLRSRSSDNRSADLKEENSRTIKHQPSIEIAKKKKKESLEQGALRERHLPLPPYDTHSSSLLASQPPLYGRNLLGMNGDEESNPNRLRDQRDDADQSPAACASPSAFADMSCQSNAVSFRKILHSTATRDPAVVTTQDTYSSSDAAHQMHHETAPPPQRVDSSVYVRQTSLDQLNGSSPFAAKKDLEFTPQSSLDECQALHVLPQFYVNESGMSEFFTAGSPPPPPAAGPPTYQYLHEESGPMGDGRWACPAVAEKLALIEAAAPRR